MNYSKTLIEVKELAAKLCDDSYVCEHSCVNEEDYCEGCEKMRLGMQLLWMIAEARKT